MIKLFAVVLAFGLFGLNGDAEARGGSRSRVAYIDPCTVTLCVTPEVKVAIAKDKGVAAAYERYVKVELACRIAKANTVCSRNYFSNLGDVAVEDPFWNAERVALEKLRAELGRYALELTK